jgi:diaminohydroxyphosphoribosylaminopyrimidine deaminase/5-amino-6-(5-phosphoribosylamino)uracil reductase
MKSADEKFMDQALKLARLGGRDVAPNPMVGAVIVKNGKVVGKGYHKKFGGPHAEVNAIKSVKKPDELKGATMYVTLEPCRHHGKTPPCLGLIEEVGISRIVCGSHDPFQQKIENRTSKIELVFLKGPVADECRQLNKFFYTWATKKRPFVTVKIAMSVDGFVAGPNGEQIWFTTRKQDKEIHKARALHQAIMVGVNTVINDNPQLTVRHVKGKDPLRVILDSKLRIPKNARVLKNKNYLIATVKKSGHRGLNVWVSPTKKQVSLKKLLKHLADIGISSVLVEPGPTLFRSLMKQGLVDEMAVYVSEKKLGKGLKINID